MEEVKSPICPECGNQESLRTLAIDDKIVWVCQECSKVFRGDEGDWWTCPKCSHILHEDGFASIERKIEVHMESCKKVANDETERGVATGGSEETAEPA